MVYFSKEGDELDSTVQDIFITISSVIFVFLIHYLFNRSFEPCWKFIQSSTEKLANVHLQVVQNLNEVAKALKEYNEQQKEKQKQVICNTMHNNKSALPLFSGISFIL